jgi:hypothetical protein
MVHHTAPPNPFPVRVLIDGRSDLPGPLCQLFLDQGGRCHLIAAGYANGAGTGSSIVLTEVRADWPPSGDAKTRGLSDDTAGNRWFINLEVDHPGNGDPLNPLQQIALPRVCAALLAHQGWPANRVIGHREWTKRKTDPNFGLTMGQLRQTVGDLIRGNEETEMNLSKETWQAAIDMGIIGGDPVTGPNWYVNDAPQDQIDHGISEIIRGLILRQGGTVDQEARNRLDKLHTI